MNVQLVNVDGTVHTEPNQSSRGMIKVDRGARNLCIVHQVDKRGIYELEERMWTGDSYYVGREWTGGRLGSIARTKSNTE